MSAVAPTRAGERRRWIALGVVCMAMLMNTLDGSVVNVALPVIQSDLHIPQAELTWVINAYLISFGSFLLLAGRLGDLVGRKRVFLAGVTLFTLASAVCGLADDQNTLIAARFVQGMGGAISSSVIIAMIVTEFPEPAQRAKAMSAYIFVAVGGGSIGLLVGGLVTETVNWHWIFFINIPVGVVTLLLGRALLEESEGIGLDKGVDWLGSITVTAALMLAIYAIVSTPDHGWGSAHTLIYGGAAIVLLGVFFVLQARLPQPDHAAAHPARARPREHEHRARTAGERPVLDLLPGRPLPRARAGRQRAAHRRRLPAAVARRGGALGRHHGRVMARFRAPRDVPSRCSERAGKTRPPWSRQSWMSGASVSRSWTISTDHARSRPTATT